ncbi:uncharacterized protein FIBRA_05296 [Fibroporia radiculosa]|uniref:Uncharacterized protein n=1 Tax=Fibroporia radiculosa TaxID=599839 RepID=J4H3F3_9APHY|nr:uncharacterized protein FIBRA_05296 [Fibroporia radiculosa]CCM03174.1 predicted protein [Fibroporia radiculosa]
MSTSQHRESHVQGTPSQEVATVNRISSVPSVDVVQPSCSRSASVVSSVLTRQDEDISSIMMRGATDLRNAKFEVEEQRRDIEFLQSQIESLKCEKEDALKRLQGIKHAAKQSLETTSKSLETTMNELKAQSQSSFEFVIQSRQSLPNVQDLRETIANAMKSIEPLLDEGGRLAQASTTRNIIDNLELEREKSQQVADILRDRLQSVGAELVDAKCRITELEGGQLADRQALFASTDSINTASQQFSALAERLEKQQRDMYEILATAADAEAKLVAATEQVAHLKAIIVEKDDRLRALEDVQRENLHMSSELANHETRISSLALTAQELDTTRSTLRERETRIRVLESSVGIKDEVISDMKTRFSVLETRISENLAVISGLEADLRDHQNRQTLAREQCNESVIHIGKLQEELQELQGKLERMHHERKICDEKLQQANSRCQTLEERFEDQSVTLKITRESNGDLQERLLAAEATHARELEATRAELSCEIILLKEQKATSQDKIRDLERQLTAQDARAGTLKDAYEDKLKEQSNTYAVLKEAEEKRATRIDSELERSRSAAETLQDRLTLATTELIDLRCQLNLAQTASQSQLEQISVLQSNIQDMERATRALSDRAKTIDVRYKKGDLDEDEKTFIQSLIQTSQAIHEKELVAKGNELRRRDNIIKDLRSKVHLLESTLAKHLQSQAKTKSVTFVPTTTAALEQKSMIDPTTWKSSDASSSPLTSQAPDRDEPSTNVDPVTSNKSMPTALPLVGRTTAAIRMITDRTLPVPFRPEESQVVPASSDTPSAAHQPSPLEEPSDRFFFRALARDSSDDIIDFEDPPASTLPLAAALGKRIKASPPPVSVEPKVANPKPPKRARTSIHKPEDAAVSVVSGDKPDPHIGASKTRSRKRR